MMKFIAKYQIHRFTFLHLMLGEHTEGQLFFFVKETDCRYKICLSTGREVYFKKANLKVQLDDDPGDIAIRKTVYLIRDLTIFFIITSFHLLSILVRFIV